MRAFPPSLLRRRSRLVALALTGLAIAALSSGLVLRGTTPAAGVTPARFAGPTSSQPLALSADGGVLAVVNPDAGSVSIFDLRADRNRLLARVPVQVEPWSVALLPDGSKAFVANTVSGTVSVMRLNIANGVIQRPHKHIAVGTEPYGLALTPNGSKLYVSNARSSTISVIDTATETVVKTIFGVGLEPRGLAVSNDGDADDADETLYVTSFLALPLAAKVDGQDDAKGGLVVRISTASDSVIGSTTLNPIPDTGFKANGDALARIAPGAVFSFTTGAYPNQLNGVALRGGFAYFPNTGASPNGPVRFDVNTQSLLSVVNRTTNLDAGLTINMHRAVADQTGTPKRFLTQPWAMAFKQGANDGYVLSAASDVVVKVNVSATTGAPTVQLDPIDPTRLLQIPTGKNPRGIVINAGDTRAYVMNYVSRDVTVINLAGGVESVMATLPSAPLPTAGTLEAKIHVGRELFNSSVGTFDPATAGGAVIAGRMSQAGWGSCASCHPHGLSDNVTWIFATGPRRTIGLHAMFDQTDPARATQRALNWSAIFDEAEDFELNIRNVSGGLGLIVGSDGVTPEPDVQAFAPLANAGRPQLKVRGVNAWDGLKAYMQFGIRSPISPLSKTDPDVIAGGALFRAANCQQCHGGAQWTSSRVRFTPPPAAGLVVGGQLISELRQVGTFDPTFFNEVRQNAAPSLGADGFNPPSLLGVFTAEPTLLHNSRAASLDEALDNVQHRSAGTGGVDTLTNAADRAKVAQFLRSIDAATPAIPF
jgi:YVTN family beta-propeller protein